MRYLTAIQPSTGIIKLGMLLRFQITQSPSSPKERLCNWVNRNYKDVKSWQQILMKGGLYVPWKEKCTQQGGLGGGGPSRDPAQRLPINGLIICNYDNHDCEFVCQNNFCLPAQQEGGAPLWEGQSAVPGTLHWETCPWEGSCMRTFREWWFWCDSWPRTWGRWSQPTRWRGRWEGRAEGAVQRLPPTQPPASSASASPGSFG